MRERGIAAEAYIGETFVGKREGSDGGGITCLLVFQDMFFGQASHGGCNPSSFGGNNSVLVFLLDHQSRFCMGQSNWFGRVRSGSLDKSIGLVLILVLLL